MIRLLDGVPARAVPIPNHMLLGLSVLLAEFRLGRTRDDLPLVNRLQEPESRALARDLCWKR